MSAHPSGLSAAERLHQIWSGLRLVALDFETTGSGREVRVVAVSAITMRAQMVTGTWSTLVNPGVPVTKASTKVHGITDDHVRNEPAFDEVRDQLLSTLRPAQETETVVLVAHNAAYDLGALRAELDRHPDTEGVLRELPTIAVLDTYSHDFHAAAGINPKRRSLAAVAELLGVSVTAAHNATSDALACAQVAARLLQRAADRGHATFDSVHTAAGAKTTTDHPTSTTISRTAKAPTLSEVHAGTHTRTLPANPTGADWEQWTADVTACLHNACPRLVDRLHAAPFTADHQRRLLHLARAIARRDDEDRTVTTALNTLAHALAENLGRVLDPDGTDRDRRIGARTLLDQWTRAFAPVAPCTRHAPCPGCAIEDECGHDIWWRPLTPALRGRFPKTPALPNPRSRSKQAERARAAHRTALAAVDAWFRPDRGTPGVLVTAAKTHPQAAHYAVWTVVAWHLEAGRLLEADALAARAVTYGYLDPRTVNHHLTHLTDARRAGDIATALTIATGAVATRAGSTDAGWNLLTSRAAHLAGVQERLGVSYTDQVDEDGNRVPKRRHHPESPRRVRPLRFARDPAQAQPSLPGTWLRINGAARYLHTTTLHIASLTDAGQLHPQAVAGVAWYEVADLDAHAAESKTPDRRVSLRKTKPRSLPKQTRRRPPGRSATDSA